jgi:tRNA-dihydrouridine synthase B
MTNECLLPVAPPKTLHYGSLRLASRYVLAPLAGYTNLPFRMVVREVGGLGLATTDLVNARALLKRSQKTVDLIDTCPGDRPWAVQIYGHEPPVMRDAAQWLEGYGADSIDINMGCPVNKVVKTGGGSALMCNVGGALELVRSVVEAVRLPVTVKMRLGWDDQDLSAPKFAREFEQAGVAAVIVHGRTREQGFSGGVDRSGIRAVVEAVDHIPIIGNGDVRTIADADRMFRETGCAGIAIGRGALLNPWIFTQLCNWETTGHPGSPPTYQQRVDFMSRHFHRLLDLRGERSACLTFRKTAGWYTKVLRPGREIHQRLMLLASAADFDAIVERLREKGPPHHWSAGDLPEISVPKGPIEHW